jgi:hypothetical protein
LLGLIFSSDPKGKNNGAIEVIQDIVEYETVEACILDGALKMKSSLQKSFIELYVNCHINTKDFERRPLYHLSRNLAEIKSEEEVKVSDEMENESRLYNIFIDMKAHIKDKFLPTHSVVDVNEVEENIFVLEMLKLCRNLFEFSVYQGMDEVKDLVQPLLGIMNGKIDKKAGKPMTNQQRFEDTAQNKIVMKIKIEVCNIVSLLFDLRLEGRITKFMQFFKQKYESSDISLLPEDEKFFNGLFSQIDFNFNGLQDILLDLSLYNNIELTTKVLHLMFRLNNQKSELADHLAQIELLSPKMISESHNIRMTFNGMKPLIGSAFTMNKKNSALSYYYSTFEREIAKNRDRTQKILRNLGFHTTVSNAMQQLSPKQVDEESVILIFKLVKEVCLKFTYLSVCL